MYLPNQGPSQMKGDSTNTTLGQGRKLGLSWANEDPPHGEQIEKSSPNFSNSHTRSGGTGEKNPCITGDQKNNNHHPSPPKKTPQNTKVSRKSTNVVAVLLSFIHCCYCELITMTCRRLPELTIIASTNTFSNPLAIPIIMLGE